MCLDLDLNPGPLACEASVLPICHGDLIYGSVKSWVFELFENLPVTTFFVGNKQQSYLSGNYFKAYDFFSLYVENVLGRPKNMANIHIFGLAILVKECSKGFDIYVTFFVACIVYPKLQILYTSLKMELYQQKKSILQL